MTRLELTKVCRNCEEDGMIVKEFYVLGGDIECMRCGTKVAEMDFIPDRLTDEPDGYPR